MNFDGKKMYLQETIHSNIRDYMLKSTSISSICNINKKIHNLFNDY